MIIRVRSSFAASFQVSGFWCHKFWSLFFLTTMFLSWCIQSHFSANWLIRGFSGCRETASQPRSQSLMEILRRLWNVIFIAPASTFRGLSPPRTRSRSSSTSTSNHQYPNLRYALSSRRSVSSICHVSSPITDVWCTMCGFVPSNATYREPWCGLLFQTKIVPSSPTLTTSKSLLSLALLDNTQVLISDSQLSSLCSCTCDAKDQNAMASSRHYIPPPVFFPGFRII